MRIRSWATGVLLLPTVSACAVTAESSFQAKALDRVSFELSCPKEQIQYTVLHRNDGLGCAGSSMGVVACGQKAVYVCTRQQEWINNTGALPAK
jgi:hypothetical protein